MNSLGKIIKKYRAAHEDLPIRAFARQCGLSHVYIMNLEQRYDPRSGKENIPTLAAVAAVAKGMGRTFEDLLEEIAEVVSIKGLNAEQKKMVKGMINYFRKSEE